MRQGKPYSEATLPTSCACGLEKAHGRSGEDQANSEIDTPSGCRSRRCALSDYLCQLLPFRFGRAPVMKRIQHVACCLVPTEVSQKFSQVPWRGGPCISSQRGSVLRLQRLCSHPESVSSISSLWEFVASGRGPGPGGTCACRSSRL